MNDENFVKLSGSGIIAELKKARIQVVAALPDIVTSDGLLWPISRNTGTRALLLMQQTGLLDSLNSIRAIAMEYQQPVCMMIGLQGKNPAEKIADAENYSVRIVKPILQLMGLKTVIIENEKDISKIATSISYAYEVEQPVCFLLGSPPKADGDKYD